MTRTLKLLQVYRLLVKVLVEFSTKFFRTFPNLNSDACLC